MSSEDSIDVGEALETLVHQFADPWSFLRELIQNSIDADSHEIDVRLDFEAERGLLVVEIVDTGVGMDRQIIDTRLTRLFSSAKDGDYTKIGRFGIGFVSVFAIEPDLVCVDTGRVGEYWRVLFRKDRSFQRIVLDTPVEGTTVRLYKQATAAEVEQARARARQVLEYWCKHAKVEIRLDDQPISRPLQLDGLCVVEHEEDGTQVVLAYVEQRAALRGYYHGGLTLHEEHDDRLPHVAFKIDSRYLEHTLTRDNVIRDENYAKAMNIVARLVQTTLVERLVEQLEALTNDAGADPVVLEQLRERLTDVVCGEGPVPELVLERPLIPALVADGQVELLSLAQVRKLAKRCWQGSPALDSSRSPVVEALLAERATILLVDERSRLATAIERVAGRRPPFVASVCRPWPCSSVERSRWQPLHDCTLRLLAELGLDDFHLELGHLRFPDSAVAEELAISQARFGELTPIAEVGKLGGGWFAGKRTIVVNADQSTVAQLLELAEVEPELAAYMLLSTFFLRTELDTERSDKLASIAAEARWLRTTP